MAITEFIDKLGPVARRWTDGAITTLSLVLLLTLVWYGMAIVNASWGNELSVLQVPMAVQYLALPVGACAMAVFVGWDLVQILRGRTHAQRYGGM
jgi:TRAP-type C4-dicarboxylate transport system permease small subunit